MLLNTKTSQLLCNGRAAHDVSDFNDSDLLFRAYTVAELDEKGKILPSAIPMPDMSCNWSRFSNPTDVFIRLRAEGTKAKRGKEGCYQVRIADARYNGHFVPVHDPTCECSPENYSHVEVRQRRETEQQDVVPPKGRKLPGKKDKQLRYEWRVHLALRIKIVLAAKPGELSHDERSF